MRAPLDLIGRRFGRLVVVERAGSYAHGGAMWRAVCDCGGLKVVRGEKLTSGVTKSCRCLQLEALAVKRKASLKWHTKHGHARRDAHTAEYLAWYAAKQRCYRPKNKHYKDYGERGIVVCDRWLGSFEAFLADMGLKPSPKHSIDRMDNDGNYEPGNCRWATAKEQQNNRRPRRKSVPDKSWQNTNNGA